MPEARAFRRAGRGKSAPPVRRGERGRSLRCRYLSYSTGSETGFLIPGELLSRERKRAGVFPKSRKHPLAPARTGWASSSAVGAVPAQPARSRGTRALRTRLRPGQDGQGPRPLVPCLRNLRALGELAHCELGSGPDRMGESLGRWCRGCEACALSRNSRTAGSAAAGWARKFLNGRGPRSAFALQIRAIFRCTRRK